MRGSAENTSLTVVLCSRKYSLEGFGSGKKWKILSERMVWEVALL